MSRSFHTTRRALEEARLADYADKSRRAKALNELQDELAAKRRVKDRAASERRLGNFRSQEPAPGNWLIRVSDETEHAHFPAGQDDLRAVIDRLPAGTLSGSGSIELSLGAKYQPECAWFMDTPLEADPLVGRRGYEILPGIYSGYVLGCYRPDRSLIHLFALVYEPSVANRKMWELYLRLTMLSTFIHEIGHHYDFAQRVARGRWRADQRHKIEIYAERVQHQWAREYVVPYLREAYPDEAAALDDWFLLYGGVALPLHVLAGDPRTTAAKGMLAVRALFTMSDAVHGLAKDVASGKPISETRLGFARDLHYAEHYEEALISIDRVLDSDPDNVIGITLKADIFVHEERFDEAEPLALRALALDEGLEDAWRALANVYEHRKEAAKLLEVAMRLLETYPQSKAGTVHLRAQIARAKLWTGDYAGFEAQIDAINASDFSAKNRWIDSLRSEGKELPNSGEKR